MRRPDQRVRDELLDREIDGTREAYPWNCSSSRSPYFPRLPSHHPPVSHIFSSKRGHACGERSAARADAVPTGRGNPSFDGADTRGPAPSRPDLETAWRRRRGLKQKALRPALLKQASWALRSEKPDAFSDSARPVRVSRLERL